MAAVAAPHRLLERISFLAKLDPQDPRYPRPRAYAVLRWVARLWFIPISAYAGNLAMNLFAFSVRTGGARLSLAALGTHATRSDVVARLIAQTPVIAVVVVGVVALLALFGRQVYRDARREAMVLRLREMWRVMERRERRQEVAQTLRGEVATLEHEVLELLAQVPAPAPEQPVAAAPHAVRERLAGLAQRSDELARELDAEAMIEALAEQQMRAWEREQRAFMAVVGGATLVAGFLVPVFSTSALG